LSVCSLFATAAAAAGAAEAAATTPIGRATKVEAATF